MGIMPIKTAPIFRNALNIETSGGIIRIGGTTPLQLNNYFAVRNVTDYRFFVKRTGASRKPNQKENSNKWISHRNLLFIFID
jgi:hypothetical protein